jgi:hypothetical protein
VRKLRQKEVAYNYTLLGENLGYSEQGSVVRGQGSGVNHPGEQKSLAGGPWNTLVDRDSMYVHERNEDKCGQRVGKSSWGS